MWIKPSIANVFWPGGYCYNFVYFEHHIHTEKYEFIERIENTYL